MNAIKNASLLFVFATMTITCPQKNNSLDLNRVKSSRATVCTSHVAVCEHDMKMYCKNCGVALYDLYGIGAKSFEYKMSGVNAGLGYVKDYLCDAAFKEVCDIARRESYVDIFGHKAEYDVPETYPNSEYPDCAWNTPTNEYTDWNYDAIKTENYYIDMHAVGKNIRFNFEAIAQIRVITNVVKLYEDSVTIDEINKFPTDIVLCDSIADMKSKALDVYAEKTATPFKGKNGIYYFYTNTMIGYKK